MEPIKTRMTFNRETKGTYVFVNEKDNAPIPTIYIKKSAFGDDEPPEQISIIIKERSA